MTRKLYDLLFWSCATLAAGTVLLAAAGCSAQALRDSGLLVAGPDGRTPLDKGIEAIPKVVGNPLDLEAWQAITAALVLGAGGVFGYKRVKARRAKTAAKKA